MELRKDRRERARCKMESGVPCVFVYVFVQLS